MGAANLRGIPSEFERRWGIRRGCGVFHLREKMPSHGLDCIDILAMTAATGINGNPSECHNVIVMRNEGVFSSKCVCTLELLVGPTQEVSHLNLNL